MPPCSSNIFQLMVFCRFDVAIRRRMMLALDAAYATFRHSSTPPPRHTPPPLTFCAAIDADAAAYFDFSSD
jgi:hypothetical protein